MIKNGEDVICKNCGVSFYIPKYRLRSVKYCSRKCHGLAVLSNKEVQAKIKRRCGKDHPRWSPLGTITSHGYRLISIGGIRIYEHRHIMEKNLGRKLKKSEQIDHLNGNKLDNRIENLRVVGIKEHLKTEHRRGVYKKHLSKLNGS